MTIICAKFGKKYSISGSRKDVRFRLTLQFIKTIGSGGCVVEQTAKLRAALQGQQRKRRQATLMGGRPIPIAGWPLSLFLISSPDRCGETVRDPLLRKPPHWRSPWKG